MLTEKEKQWLNARPDYPSMLLSGDDDDDERCECYIRGKSTYWQWFDLVEGTDMLTWKNAAVLEARVAVELASYEYLHSLYPQDLCPFHDSKCPYYCTWCRNDQARTWLQLRYARLKVEEEIG